MPSLVVTVYQRIHPDGEPRPGNAPDLIAKLRVHLPDRPGSLASFGMMIAGTGGNISFFHYDRSTDSNRVAVEVQYPDRTGLDRLLGAVAAGADRRDHAPMRDEVQITSMESVLEVKVRLENRPGTLAAFATLLADHRANVIYMLYDEEIDAEAADIAVATEDPAEITTLLAAMNERGYQYSVLYRGAGEEEVARAIGLKLVEKFFLRLRKLMPASDIEELKSLVASSQDLHQDLVGFYTEAGNDLEAGDVFEKVLTFASRSRGRTGPHFHAAEMRPLTLPGGVDLLGFRMPTSENLYIFRHADELTLIDAGHGIYFEDLKRLFRGRSLDPSRVRRVLVTHPDTDHAGASGYFQQEFGSEVYLHPGSTEVIQNRNRAWGASGSLLNLNKYYTRLSSRFTECRFPARPRHFPLKELGVIGGFRIIDRVPIGPLQCEVLESRGGHTPGLVFYLVRSEGLLFTSDFLINVPSLSPEEKEHLGIYRYLLTSPNRDNRLYKEETEALTALALGLDSELQAAGKEMRILPGHGEHYPAGTLVARGKLAGSAGG